jgi:hypothetical protein
VRGLLELPAVQFAILGVIVVIGVGVPLAIVGWQRHDAGSSDPQCTGLRNSLEHTRNVPTETADLYRQTLDWARHGCDPDTFPGDQR